MAAEKDPLEVEIAINMKKLASSLAAAEARMVKAAKKMEDDFRSANTRAAKSMDQVVAATDRAGRSLAGLRTILLGALSVNEIVAYADAWTVAGNKIAAASEVSGRSARDLGAINDIATETRSTLTATADLYAKLLRATAGVAESEEDVARATGLVNKAFKAGGAAASEQAAGILQLAQGLSSGVLQGDELRSLRENAPLLAKAIADAFGTSVGGLKDLGAEGKLTADKVFAAILAAQPEIEAAFARTNTTIGEGFTLLRNALTEYIGVSDSSVGATRKIGAALAFLAENIDTVVLAATAIGASFLGRGLAAVLARIAPIIGGAVGALSGLSAGGYAAAAGLTALRGAIGILGGPIGATLAALTLLPAVIETNEERVDAMRQASDEAVGALDAYATASQRVAEEQDKLGGKVKTATLEILNQSRISLQEALQKLKEEAENTKIDITGTGFFGSDDLTKGADAIRTAINADPLGNSFLAGIEAGLRELRQGRGDAKAVADEMARIGGIGDEVLPVVNRFMQALQEGDNGALAQVQSELVALATMLGGFEAELQAVKNATTDETRIAAYQALRDRILEAAQAGEVLRQTNLADLREILSAYGLQKAQIAAIEAALVGNNEEVQRILEGVRESAGETENLADASAGIDFSGAAASARQVADELRRAVGAAIDLRSQSLSDLSRAKIAFDFRDDPLGGAAALAAAEFDARTSSGAPVQDGAANFIRQQREDVIKAAVEAEKYRLKLSEVRSAATDTGSSGGGARDGSIFDIGQDQIDSLNAQIAAIGQTAAQTAELRAKTELLNEAKRRGLDLDAVQAETGQTLRQEIDAQAATIGRLTVAYDAAREKAEFFKGVTQDLKDGLIDAIVDGESFIGTLEGIARAMAKALLQASLFGDGPLAGLFGQAPGVGLLSGLLGGFDKGGYTGAGGKYDPAGIVHKGEYVFSADAVRRIGVPNLEGLHRQLKGFSSGGLVGGGAAQPATVASPVTVAPVVKVIVLDDKRKLGEFLNSAEGDAAFVAALRRNQGYA